MTFETSKDFSLFFDSDEFAETATYTPSGGSGSAISVIFDKPYQSVSMDSGNIDVEDIKPTVYCKTTDVSSAAHGDAIILDSITYFVIGIESMGQSGGQSLTILYLEDQS
tara:strand:- start:1782 stop:2111 length:330 start_codon:yes stop_codon:yes gene_type:complete